MGIVELSVLKWAHIIAMVYWLGGEWGVFQISFNVVNRKLSMDERKRHLETAYRIDILARTGILLLFPLGFHMGNIWGIQPYGGWALVAVWSVFSLWLALCWTAFFFRETDRGVMLTKIDEKLRYIFIPVIAICAISSLSGNGPFIAVEGMRWFSVKILLFSVLLCIGLYLRFVMRQWTTIFRQLAEKQDDALEAELEDSIRISRYLAYLYWIIIAGVGFLGATKPF
ncbi:hypothetical protein Q4567_08415 [Aliiglaciecola sp. 2_MG-2023]|uniref:hypothetical protein n=1 Tax=unclassified Aliiglaciecola TaxID=2593648 RepID=UPI0026E2C757|nr:MULTISPECIES: hypothetical protein [unclassified Aliiglaciecola]MDO6710737.1 hypothetical protein [Aliiglaciecola sp. 2_MG-2023]MDO6751855.1 hypothetical protein [Aliiglaciecola sp. 1_MG-2023]